MKLLSLGIVAVGLFASQISFAAGKCSYTTTREACNKEAEKESYAKCNGKQVCEPVVKMVGDEAACMASAVDACTNARFQITKSKTIKVEFGGKVIAEDACAKDTPPKFVRKEHFDRCG